MGGVGQAFTAKHAGDFAHPVFTGEQMNRTANPLGIGLLDHHPVVIGAGGDLGQVCDRQDLAIPAQLLHHSSHGFGHCTAHAGVHLIKNQGLRGAQLAGGDRDGQRDAGEFATGSHFGHRTRRAVGVAGHQKLNILQTVAGGFWQGFEGDFKTPTLHAQLLHGRRHTGRQLDSSLLSNFAQPLGPLMKTLCGSLLGFFKGLKVCSRIALRQILLPLGVEIG